MLKTLFTIVLESPHNKQFCCNLKIWLQKAHRSSTYLIRYAFLALCLLYPNFLHFAWNCYCTETLLVFANTIPLEITEILPNPEGPDLGNEYIILKNQSNSEISLEGLYLDDQEGESSPFNLNSYTIAPLGELTLTSETTGISINNHGDQIRILNAMQNPVITLDVPESGENSRYFLTKDGSYTWETEFKATSRTVFPETVTITEIMPNPEEAETEGEWIEIKNTSTETINLAGLLLDDCEDGSSPYELPEIEIAPLSYAVIYRPDSKISLNNSNDSARILTPEEKVLSSVEYEKTTEGLSYQLVQIINAATGEAREEWQWTEPTEGTTNKSIYSLRTIVTEFITLTETLITENDTFSTSSLNISEELKETTFQPETEMELLYETINGENQIIDFEILNEEETQLTIEIESTEKPLYDRLLPYIVTVLAVGLLAIYESRKKP